MDAPPPQEDVRPFVRIGRHLIGARPQRAGRSDAEDAANGFLLLEDLGDDTFARVLGSRRRRRRASTRAPPTCWWPCISAGAHALLPGLGAYAGEALIDAAMLLPEWYLPGRHRPADVGRRNRPTIAPPGAPASPTCRRRADALLLRDYHKDNLMWLPARPGVRACGLLDFQDAQQGHPSYDLVSLIEDARRDVSPAVQRRLPGALHRRDRASTGGTSAPASP